MKELDLLLERFISANESQLAEGAWPELESLLSVEDDKFWDWVQYPDQAEPPQFRDLLEKISRGQG
jgi:succinate dehydrogenase flavin-adding protein (antitoxin of CptAB toxin-antitoxin module)